MYYSFNKLITMALAITLLAACQKDKSTDPDNPMPGDNQYSLGWHGLDENVGEVPMTSYFGFGTGNIPDKYDLTEYLPPIGDQGNYGTCVSWAVGYNVKSAISAIEKGLNSQALADPNNQFSPKDLFVSIPDNDKGANCEGTNFQVALKQMQERGIARMSTVPYTDLRGCSQNDMQSAWTQDAANNKIEYWRRIEATPESIKQNIAKNIPVIMGAKLADNFMSWNSDAVLTSNSSYNNVGIHSYHALAIVGYDDSKGPNGAFRVVNSWGDNWGDTGFIWIDYNFLVNEFVVPFNGGKPLFIAANQEGEERTDPPNNDPTVTSGVDLAAWVFEDYSTVQTSGDPLERQSTLNYYNIGREAAKAQDEWSVYYIYYNAFDVNDYGVVFYDEFNTSIATNTYDCPDLNHCVINVDIPSGSDFAYETFGDYAITRTYNMPEITGMYYLILFVDGGEAYQEDNEANNIFYTSEWPIPFVDGYGAKGEDSPSLTGSSAFTFKNTEKPVGQNLEKGTFYTAVNKDNPNAYTPNEIHEFFVHQKKTGQLEKKAYLSGDDNGKKAFVRQQNK